MTDSVTVSFGVTLIGLVQARDSSATHAAHASHLILCSREDYSIALHACFELGTSISALVGQIGARFGLPPSGPCVDKSLSLEAEGLPESDLILTQRRA